MNIETEIALQNIGHVSDLAAHMEVAQIRIKKRSDYIVHGVMENVL